jgi:hypothetical protein
VRAHAWGVLMQQCGWCKASGGRLAPTKIGASMLDAGPRPEDLRQGLEKLQNDNDFDEFNRINHIRGQGGKGGRVLIITTDLLGLPKNIADPIAQALMDKHHLKREQIVLSSSHTHSGPVLRESLIDVYPMTSADWDKIMSELHKEGYDPVLVGDHVKQTRHPEKYFDTFTGMYEWNLYDDRLAKADRKQAYDFCSGMNNGPVQWALAKPDDRLAIGIVYPGFNDAKILGWDLGKPRVIDITGKDFYEESWKAVLDSKYGFDWILVATWNDWTEGTIIEPDKDNGYIRSIITQNFIEKFKGLRPLDDNLMQKITEDYLKNPKVKKYK